MATLQNLNFNPLSISGCSLWLDAADRSTLGLAGTNVNQWNDKSGNARNLTTSAGTVTYSNNRLVFPSASIMSGPSMSFTGSIFIVAQPTGTTADLNQFIGPTGGGLAIRYNTSYLLSNPGNDSDIGFGGAYVINGTQITVANPALNAQNNIIYTPIVNGFTGTFTISTTFLSRYFIGNMHEMIMYTTSLTALQRQQVEGYLAWKWSLAANLPASHPYKLIGPNAAGLSYPSGLTVPIPRQSFASSSTPLVFGFLPTSIPGCQLWFDAIDTSTVSLTGTQVTQWRDKSGNNRSTSSSVGTSTYVTSGINGRAAVFLNNTYFLGSVNITTTTVQVFAVATLESTASSYGFLLALSAGSFSWNNTSSVGSLGREFTTNVLRMIRSPSTISPPSAVTYNVPFLVGSSSAPNSQAMNLNGETPNTSSSGTTASFGITSFAIGSDVNPASSEFWKGYVGEILVYNTILSTAQRQQVEGYLAWKWGVQASLPANHPYRSIVPGLTINVPIPLQTLQGASFSPTILSGLSLWLDATDTSTISLTGTAVNQWNDKSGNGRNLTPSGTVTYSTNKLTFPSGSIMTGPSMSFNGSIFLVVRVSAGTGGDNMIIGQAGLDKSIRYDASFKLNNPGNSNDIGSGGAYIVNGTQITITNPALNTQNNIIYTPIINGFTGTFSISNTLFSRFFIGDMFEVIMYTSALSTTQRQSIEGYLAWKWGLVGSLPVTHPFKKFPPPPM